jgi:hypothetical protein
VRMKLRGVVAFSALLVMTTMSGSASASPPIIQSYNSIPKHIPGNVPSVGFEATAASEFGDEVLLTTAGAHLVSVRVIMSSWGCQSGTWFGDDCLTATGASFSLPITLNIYAGNTGPAPGALLATQSRTFNIAYRPSSNSIKCTGVSQGEWWSKASNTCYNGHAQAIVFAFPSTKNARITLPQDVVWTIAYNTTHYGYAPIGQSAPCFTSSGGCGYDSLNVGVETFPGQPNHGTDVDPAGVYWNTSVAANYCDGGSGGVGTLRLDTGCPPATTWAGYTPLATIKTN